MSASPSGKIEVYLTGGFTGIGGKWQVDADRLLSGSELPPAQRDRLRLLLARVRQENSLGRDFTSAPSRAAPPVPSIADAQTYEVRMDGKSTKWSEPPSAEAAATPAALVELKNWIRENAPREPLPPARANQ